MESVPTTTSSSPSPSSSPPSSGSGIKFAAQCPIDWTPKDVPDDGIYGLKRVSRHPMLFSLSVGDWHCIENSICNQSHCLWISFVICIDWWTASGLSTSSSFRRISVTGNRSENIINSIHCIVERETELEGSMGGNETCKYEHSHVGCNDAQSNCSHDVNVIVDHC